MCSKLVHVLFTRTLLHEQRAHAQHNHVDGGGVGFGITPNIYEMLKQVL
jgi:hypothetical protein